jgi:hypothetical protein
VGDVEIVNDAVKLDILCREKESLRNVVVEHQRALNTVFITGVTVAGAFIATYFGKDMIALPDLRPKLLFGLAQLEFVLLFYAAMLNAGISAHAGYIRAIERKINSIAKEPLCIWDSEVAPVFVGSRRGVQFWLIVALWGSFIVLFVFLVYIAIHEFRNVLLSALVALESGVLIEMSVLSRLEPLRVARFAEGKFDVPKQPGGQR